LYARKISIKSNISWKISFIFHDNYTIQYHTPMLQEVLVFFLWCNQTGYITDHCTLHFSENSIWHAILILRFPYSRVHRILQIKEAILLELHAWNTSPKSLSTK
jgi:hypothetical protein